MNENTTTQKDVVIERVLNAATDLVWKLWTEPDHFKNWYGPQGVNVPVARFDLQVGGERTVCMEMTTPEGPRQMWTTGEHREISPESRLIYTESMADADGNVMEMPGVPSLTEVTVALEDVDGRTRMVLTHAGVPAGSPGESGWNMAFDKLAAYVQKLK